MKKSVFAAALCALLFLSSCAPKPQPQPTQEPEDTSLHIVASTYPVYCFTTAVTEGVEGIEVTLLVNQQTSCLHDYTLTVNDMKALEKADVVVINGAGLEDFMTDALAASDGAQLIDCSKGLPLLPMSDGAADPHIWLDAARAAQMVDSIASALSVLDLENANAYAENADKAVEVISAAGEEWNAQAAAFSCKELITFHDGFQYFADGLGLSVLASVEEDEGSSASAADIKEIIRLARENQIPAVFTEVNGSDAAANAISRETGVAVYSLDLIMSGEEPGLQPYLDRMQHNLDTLTEAFS